jgi:hypothetical protein
MEDSVLDILDGLGRTTAATQLDEELAHPPHPLDDDSSQAFYHYDEEQTFDPEYAYDDYAAQELQSSEYGN